MFPTHVVDFSICFMYVVYVEDPMKRNSAVMKGAKASYMLLF